VVYADDGADGAFALAPRPIHRAPSREPHVPELAPAGELVVRKTQARSLNTARAGLVQQGGHRRRGLHHIGCVRASVADAISWNFR
jgi:hypothetical protein